jgi:hypothetical protein
VGRKETIMSANNKSIVEQAQELKSEILQAAMRGQTYVRLSWIERHVPITGAERQKAIDAVVAYAKSQDVEVK